MIRPQGSRLIKCFGIILSCPVDHCAGHHDELLQGRNLRQCIKHSLRAEEVDSTDGGSVDLWTVQWSEKYEVANAVELANQALVVTRCYTTKLRAVLGCNKFFQATGKLCVWPSQATRQVASTPLGRLRFLVTSFTSGFYDAHCDRFQSKRFQRR